MYAKQAVFNYHIIIKTLYKIYTFTIKVRINYLNNNIN